MKDAYNEIFLIQIMLLGSFCQLKNSKTNINILIDLSELLEERKGVQFRLDQEQLCCAPRK